MFNTADQRKRETVQLVLSDGRAIDGTLLLPMSGELRRALGGDSAVLGAATARCLNSNMPTAAWR